MSFLAPIFLLGSAAIALPVVFHLIRRSTRERTVFSSLMFLSPSPPTLSRRSRLEQILLLIVRCVILCLLALAFARPFLKSLKPPESGSAPKRILVLLDTSASIRRGDLWAQAKRKAAAIAHRASPADQLAVFTFDNGFKTLLGFEEWNDTEPSQRAALVQGKLDQTAPGWASTSLGQALVNSAEILSETPQHAPAKSELILISDMQEGSRLSPVQGYDWPKNVHLTVDTAKLQPRSNASLQLVSSVNETNAKAPQAVRVRVSNAADSKREEFKVGWAANNSDFLSAPQQVYVPPGASRVISLSIPAGVNPRPERVLLKGDDDDFDNTVFAAAPEPLRLHVSYLGADSETNPRQQLYFLKRAFQETPRESVVLRNYGPDQAVAPAEALETTLFIAAGPLSDERARELRAHVESGKTLLFVTTEESSSRALARVLGLENLRLREASGTNYSILSGIEFQHPLFAPFADPRYSDFSRIHFWQHRVINPAEVPQSRVLARFDTGAPALLESAIGKGRVLILTSGWNPQDSQLALSTKFVPLLYSLLEYGGAPSPAPMQFYPGDTVLLPQGRREEGFNVRSPDGSVLRLNSAAGTFTNTLLPGVYYVSTGETTQRFVVNLDPAESRTAPLPSDQLESMGAPVSAPESALASSARREVRLHSAELENRQKFWRWIIIATLAVVFVETLLSLRAARLALLQTPAPISTEHGT